MIFLKVDSLTSFVDMHISDVSDKRYHGYSNLFPDHFTSYVQTFISYTLTHLLPNYFVRCLSLGTNRFLTLAHGTKLIFQFQTPSTKLFLTVYFSLYRMILFYEKVFVLCRSAVVYLFLW